MSKIAVDLNSANKFAEAILYIAYKSQFDPKFGAIKLNKILFYSDFFAYRELGKSITGVEYQHLDEGPAPKALLPVREKLISDGSIELEYRRYFNGVQERIVAKRKPDLHIFTPEEINTIDEVIDALKNLNGREVTELSHKEFGWKLTNDGEVIPFRTAWFSTEPLNMDQIEYGKKIAGRYGLAR
ncbi:MAG TPA: Panacea domain-containing protein [Nitrospiria bacterium]|nr:Panacea domain-containing protein [Nitrospiria bacterium]